MSESNPLDDLLADEDEAPSLLDEALSSTPPPAYERDEAFKRGHVTWLGEESSATFEWQERGEWFSNVKTFADFEEARAWVDGQFGVRRGMKGYAVQGDYDYE